MRFQYLMPYLGSFYTETLRFQTFKKMLVVTLNVGGTGTNSKED